MVAVIAEGSPSAFQGRELLPLIAFTAARSPEYHPREVLFSVLSV